jgi:Icc protein
MPDPRLRFLHISDLHILAEEGQLRHGADTTAILQEAVSLMNALQPDCIVATGDLIGDGREDSYRRLQSLLRRVAAPLHVVMGNHDDRAAFRRVFRPAEPDSDAPLCEAFEQGGLRFLLLDSTIPGKEEGRLDGSQLEWLEQALAAHPDQATWLFLHHQPLPIYLRWLDALGLQDPEPFLAVVNRHPQVTAVAYGHVHQVRRFRYRGVLFLSVPALAFQFSAHSQTPLVTLETPAFRRIEIADGKQQSWLHFLDGQVVPEPALPAVPIYVR